MELEENAAMYLVGDRYVNAWGQGDFVSTKQVKAIHKKSAAEVKAANEQADADDDEDEGDEEEEGYGSWNVAQLKKELANRELSTAGNRKTLVARLEEADEAADEEDDVNEDDEVEEAD